MPLSEPEIHDALATDSLHIDHPDPDVTPHVEPSSVDLRLGETILRPESAPDAIDVTDPTTYPEHTQTTTDRPEIAPGEFLLATTQERVALSSSLVGILHGRSSVGRLGLFVENAGLIDSGFTGQVTLELYNAGPSAIRLAAGMRICQLTFHRHDDPPDVAYSPQRGSKYQGQDGPTPSRLYEDFTWFEG